MDSSRILVVDDERDTLGLIELTLQTAGYLVSTAISGGYQIIESLREKGTNITPIVFLTAKGRDEDVEMGEKFGAAAYLKKPTTRGDLLDTIQEVLDT
jgi:DNA-binding response OmpR family regulator